MVPGVRTGFYEKPMVVLIAQRDSMTEEYPTAADARGGPIGIVISPLFQLAPNGSGCRLCYRTPMERPARYRVDDGRACIDIKIRTVQQLFDGRDPSPFRERDLDEDAVDYIIGAAKDIGPKAALKLVVWISEGSPQHVEDATIVEAIRTHFAYELDRMRRKIRDHVRQGQLALVVGLTFLVGFLTLAKFAEMLPAGGARQVLHEGLVITGWVAMWRPLEVLLYDWWPLVRQRRHLTRILGAEITIAR